MSTVVLLTSTVVPHEGVARLAVTDPAVRLEQYAEAVAAWSAQCQRRGWRLVLLDNSTALGEGASQRLQQSGAEVVLLPEHAPHRDKGVGESRLLQRAMAAGVADGATTLVKCTGRLVVTNMDACLPPGDAPSLRVLLSSRLTTADARTWVVSRAVWDAYLHDLPDRQEDLGIIAEQALARATLRALADGVPLSRYPALPRWRGVSGGHGNDFGSPRARLVRRAHTVVRDVAARGHWSL